MLNKKNERELCYVVIVDDVLPIEGKDRVECAKVGGWTIMVRKGQFHPGDVGIYFEIDSKVPEKEPFEFLESKKYKIKTQRYKTPNGFFYSQGLLMHPSDFGWESFSEAGLFGVLDEKGKAYYTDNDSKFLTKKLGVVHASNVSDKTNSSSKKRKIFPFSLLFKKDGPSVEWPYWVNKTDEERVENMPWVLNDVGAWVATEKIDGTSTTFTMKRGKFKKHKFFVCSRNVCFNLNDVENNNVYVEMAKKHNIKYVLTEILKKYPDIDWVTIQGETYGKGIQKNTYDLQDHEFAAFNLITSTRDRWGTLDMVEFLSNYNVPTVPVLDCSYYLPDTIEELRNYVHSSKSTINNKIKEGIVFRSFDGSRSFKCVDPDYLKKWD